jgi:hypothetical protein
MVMKITSGVVEAVTSGRFVMSSLLMLTGRVCEMG